MGATPVWIVDADDACWFRPEATGATHGVEPFDLLVAEAVRPVSVVHSVRLPAELSHKLEVEATRQGLTPSVLIRELVSAALLAAEEDETVTVRVANLHRAIDLALHRAA